MSSTTEVHRTEQINPQKYSAQKPLESGKCNFGNNFKHPSLANDDSKSVVQTPLETTDIASKDIIEVGPAKDTRLNDILSQAVQGLEKLKLNIISQNDALNLTLERVISRGSFIQKEDEDRAACEERF